MSKTTIKIDVLSAVEDFYPGLTYEQAITCAERIAKNWDYSTMYDIIAGEIECFADEQGIDLEGKDGVVEQEDNIYVLNSSSSLFP
tara:strand:+ start:95 stop:352 length:258 start_codon:yes stop_codon:yes gene_type:complete